MQHIAIFGLSALTLFIEMLLVRWLSTEVHVFAYVQNGVLISAFLGLGVGCARARAPIRLLPGIACFVLLGAVIRDPWQLDVGGTITGWLAVFQDTVVWGTGAAAGAESALVRARAMAQAIAATMALLFAIALTLLPLGQMLGRRLAAAEHPIAAYSSDICGSIVGILSFQALTVARSAPWLWLLVAAFGLCWLIPQAQDAKIGKWSCAALLAVLPVCGVAPTGETTLWSPYQKLSLVREPSAPADCALTIDINGTYYQHMVNLDRAHSSGAELPAAVVRSSHYVLPYELIGQRHDVLVVGAGSGNDVAAALRAGAQTIDAVEIDPVILDWGRQLHPSHPYASPKVQVTLDDARAYLRNTAKRYDLVWFGLLDSHTNPSAYTHVRLDHFVYTRESFARVKELLRPGGVVVLYFQAERSWIAKRMLGLMSETFLAQPLMLRMPRVQCLGPGGLLLIGGPRQSIAPVWARALSDPQLSHLVEGVVWKGDVELTHDDWPYLYLEAPGVPAYHLCIAAAALALMLLTGRRWGLHKAPDWVMFLLGAGFMLLEVTAVSRAALLFGATWTVNAYVISLVLGLVLLANLLASLRLITDQRVIMAGLSLCLLALYVVPHAAFVGFGFAMRVCVGGTFLALPVLFAGLLFIAQWRDRPERDHAFGSNLLGSLVGGLASLLSMWLGFKALALVALLFYLLAYARVLRSA